MEKKTNKAKLEFFHFFPENRLNHKAISLDKIGGNWALSANSIKIHLSGYFLHAEFISAMKTAKSYVFQETRKKNRKMINFSNF